MPRRSRHQRWVLVLTAVAGTFIGTAAAAQPSEHDTPPTTTVAPTTVAPTTAVPTTVPPTTVGPPTTEVPTTTTETPPIPTTTEPPIQEPTTTTTEAPPIPTTTEPPIQEPSTTTTEPPVTEPADPGDGDGDDAVVVPVDDGDAPSGDDATGSPLPGVSGDSTGDVVDDDEVALPSAEFLFSDGRALVSPPETGQTDTRPLWVAVLLGLAAGIGLTATASVVSNNLHREHPES